MAKGKITHRSVEHNGENGLSRQSQTDLTVDTAPLPPAEELEKYQKLNPDIIQFLLKAAEKEQANRHWAEKEKIKIVSRSEKRTTQINVTGMVFAFFAIVVIFLVCAYALYLNRTWFAGIMATLGVATIVGSFTQQRNESKK